MPQFWATAVQRAAIARGLAAELHPNEQSDVFTIGLLEDMGIPIMANREGDFYRDLYLTWQQDDDLDLISEEKKFCGIDHATLGAQMAKHWGFPATLATAIGHHHQLDSNELPLSLKIASLVKGPLQEAGSRTLADKAQALFGLDAELSSEWIECILRENQELAAAIS